MPTSSGTLLALSVKYLALAPIRCSSRMPSAQPASTARWYSSGTPSGICPGAGFAAWMSASYPSANSPNPAASTAFRHSTCTIVSNAFAKLPLLVGSASPSVPNHRGSAKSAHRSGSRPIPCARIRSRL